ncbi:hypothetical protein Pyn_27043 [Prunus yedoensis var. nudiflora]|uniref:Uncharacterized protein n=1 Tax=Prunus yedoensis var. nudiflora TaxID=2094558 RepID=A0A314YB81_PRUYE|nr:hypothetical protein Pyn_27043 [Prunus yedoensis var. nudiflora]
MKIWIKTEGRVGIGAISERRHGSHIGDRHCYARRYLRGSHGYLDKSSSFALIGFLSSRIHGHKLKCLCEHEPLRRQPLSSSKMGWLTKLDE